LRERRSIRHMRNPQQGLFVQERFSITNPLATGQAERERRP
jgi:hypothetical protein